jgi:PAS domain S-box-containing protein
MSIIFSNRLKSMIESTSNPGIFGSPISTPLPIDSVLGNLPVAYVEFDVNGIIRALNAAALRMFNSPFEELIGRQIWDFVPHDEASRNRAEFFQLLESGEDPPVIRRVLLTADGEYRTHEVHRRILRDSSGTPEGVSSVTFDVSEAEAVHREAEHDRLWLRSVVNAIPQAVIATDALGYVRLANSAAEELTGWAARELIGRQIEEALPIQRSTSASQKPLTFFDTLYETWNGDVELLDRKGQTISVWLSASPTIDKESGSTNGVVLVLPSAQARARRNQK